MVVCHIGGLHAPGSEYFRIGRRCLECKLLVFTLLTFRESSLEIHDGQIILCKNRLDIPEKIGWVPHFLILGGKAVTPVKKFIRSKGTVPCRADGDSHRFICLLPAACVRSLICIPGTIFLLCFVLCFILDHVLILTCLRAGSPGLCTCLFFPGTGRHTLAHSQDKEQYQHQSRINPKNKFDPSDFSLSFSLSSFLFFFPVMVRHLLSPSLSDSTLPSTSVSL